VAASTSTHRYGPATDPAIPGLDYLRGPAIPSNAPAILRRFVLRAWEEPALEATRVQLQDGAMRAGISGHTGSYAQAAERTGFARELQRISGPRETGALAEHFKRAWGKSVGFPPPF
jgi:hypothetical protein